MEFLSRLYDLENIPSTDSRFDNALGYIWQHRINNYVWVDNWVFSDKRFDLLHCDEVSFLQFLCEMLHPIVRSATTQVAKLHQLFNEYLSKDIFELDEKTRISESPILLVDTNCLEAIQLKSKKGNRKLSF